MKIEPYVMESVAKRRISIAQLATLLGEHDFIEGNPENQFSNIADIHNVNEDSLDWVHRNNRDPWQYLLSSKAKILLMPIDCRAHGKEIPLGKTVIFSTNPMLLFARIARELFVIKPDPGIHPSAVIHPKARVGNDVYIGPLCYIGNCEIGDKCIIHSHVSIEDNVKIGTNVLIKNGARIGQPGFGFVKNELDAYEKFPQIGSVIIEDNVEIGAITCIDRGALSITRIRSGTKIDNMVQVAHNVQIGENCIVTGNVSIGGSCKIGDNVWIGPSSTIKDGLSVGSGAFINMGSVVIRRVKSGDSVIGYPAEPKDIFALKKYEISKLYKKRSNR